VANQENVSEILVHAKRGERIPMNHHGQRNNSEVGDRVRCEHCTATVIVPQNGECPNCGHSLLPKQPKAVSGPDAVDSRDIENTLG